MLNFEQIKKMQSRPNVIKTPVATTRNKTKYGFRPVTLNKVLKALQGVKKIQRAMLVKKTGLNGMTIDKVMDSLVIEGKAEKRYMPNSAGNAIEYKMLDV